MVVRTATWSSEAANLPPGSDMLAKISHSSVSLSSSAAHKAVLTGGLKTGGPATVDLGSGRP